MTYTLIDQALKPYGMFCRGGFAVSNADGLGRAGSLVLVGNAGAALWGPFETWRSQQTGSDHSHPLDDWTRLIVGEIAGEFDARALYPFDGPPYHPFQQWAKRSEPVFSSPIGPLIHPEFGLWHAYRAALIVDENIEFPEFQNIKSPCDACLHKPCLTRCPVGAFQPDFYDVPRCVSHLTSGEGGACRTSGCRARHTCPIGQSFAYLPEQAQFHMDKFVESQTERSD